MNRRKEHDRHAIYLFSADVLDTLYVGGPLNQETQLSVLEVESLEFCCVCHRLPGLLVYHFRGDDGNQIVLEVIDGVGHCQTTLYKSNVDTVRMH